MAYIQFLGAAGTVTGSKHLLNVSGDAGGAGLQILIDCGLFQGQKEWRQRNWEPSPIPPDQIEAVILTHAHLDHCGYIPRLVKQGFKGTIYATPATIDLAAVVLQDSGHLQEEDAAYYNKTRSSKHIPALPLYTEQDAIDSINFFKPLSMEQVVQISSQLSFRFVRAAHIMGSGMAEITCTDCPTPRKFLFTGDIGRVRDSQIAPGKVVYAGPFEGEAVDILVMESTYGNRLHPTTDPRPELIKTIKDTVARGGTVVVPAFAVERTQKFLFMIKDLMETGQIPRVPVHCDSPMAIKAIQIYIKHQEEYSEEAKVLIQKYGSPLKWDGFFFDTNQQDSKKINDSHYPQIIISSSGMATGGRILHHLIQRLPDPKNQIIFIGFQASGTRGAIIKSGAKTVKIFNQDVPIRAQVAAIEQFSDHADTPELLEWLRTFKKAPQVTYLVHGEPAASSQLRLAMTSALSWKVEAAQWMQKVEVK
jgi:metallo-beta-lactamase family protein